MIQVSGRWKMEQRDFNYRIRRIITHREDRVLNKTMDPWKSSGKMVFYIYIKAYVIYVCTYINKYHCRRCYFPKSHRLAKEIFSSRQGTLVFILLDSEFQETPAPPPKKYRFFRLLLVSFMNLEIRLLLETPHTLDMELEKILAGTAWNAFPWELFHCN